MPAKKTERAAPRGYADEAARAAIVEDLDTTLLVEAAAGTGKTSSLVDRMVALVAAGKTTVDRLSAVTFTIRAAAQLSQRFQNALEAAVRKETDPERRKRLSAALSGIDSCFVGTIHAFAARLLRERPVEAGIDPRFTEMDDPQDRVERGRAWDRFTEGLFLSEDPRLARLMELGVRLDDLRDGFHLLCENSDVEAVVGPRTAEPDFAHARSSVWRFLDEAAADLPPPPAGGAGNDFAHLIARAQRLRRLFDSERGSDFVQILKVLRRGSVPSGAGRFRKLFETLREDVVKPALASWAEYLYPDVLAVLADARDRYAAWRRREGRANFQDLLLDARNLLRDHPDVRAALALRFTPILVDEFQDTDPIQAEIVFYLTGSDRKEKRWMRLEPLPGSLFVVGDPKQSIYRFRRADIETYEVVRSRIEKCGRVVLLSTNFRSTPALCEWINRVFDRPSFFPREATREQAAYVPLFPASPDTSSSGSSDSSAQVFRLDSPASRNADWPVAENDARSIADAVASDLAQGRRRPEDFLLLFRRRRYMPEYARALEERNIPFEIGGGGAFGACEELGALLPLLQALADPDNPVPFLAALRGPIFGLDDEALYRFSLAGGRFSSRATVPASADPRIGRAVDLFREGERLVETLPPAAAISRLTERLGWTALAAARELGDSRAGNLLKALAAARKLSGEGLDFLGIVDELERLRQEELIEQMSVEPGRSGVVRLMTLYGAKGLEAPVVFLCEPTRDPGRPRDYRVDRSVDPPRGFFRVYKKTGDFAEDEIARPPGWAAAEENEEHFDRAEKTRLLYVGATRARDTLVVSVKRSSTGKAGGPWEPLDPHLPANLARSSAASPVSRASISADQIGSDLAQFRQQRQERGRRSSMAGESAVSVTSFTHRGEKPGWQSTGRGMTWGRVLHRLLEGLMRDPALDVRAYASNLLAEEDREATDLDEVVSVAEGVRASPLWARALAASRRLVEVPFALTVASADLGLDDAPKETLLSGAIDLVFEEEDAWRLIDYKSDTIAGNRDELVRFYAPQIEHYRRYWESLTAKKTTAGLYFIRSGEEVWLS